MKKKEILESTSAISSLVLSVSLFIASAVGEKIFDYPVFGIVMAVLIIGGLSVMFLSLLWLAIIEK